MLEKLFNIFKRKKDLTTSDKHPYVSKLEFGIKTDGTIDIVCHWPEFDDTNEKAILNIAYFYALAIHAIDSGLLHKEIIETMRQSAKLNEFDTLFVHNVLYKLYELEKSQQYQKNINLAHEPLIQPLDVFKNMN